MQEHTITIKITEPLTKEDVAGIAETLTRNLDEINKVFQPKLPVLNAKEKAPKSGISVDEVKSIIRMFASSQGFYGRLAAHLDENNAWEAFTDAANKAGVKEVMGLIEFIEC